jgi:HEAT repeat protein
MSMSADPHELVEKLAVPHHAKGAFRDLMRHGKSALDAVRPGLTHESAAVRTACARFLDFFLEPETFEALVAMLDDPSPAVRATAMHSLACDRCKAGSCRPEEGKDVPMALRMLADDCDGFVRAMAVEVVGQYVHTRPEAEAALLAAIRSDPAPMVRKKAKWFAPGGPIYKRTAPKPVRKARQAA